MTNDELLDNIIDLMAYDQGCASGIHDDELKERCKQLVDERRRHLDEIFTAHVHNWTAPDSGCNIEDAAKFIAYLGDEMGWDCR